MLDVYDMVNKVTPFAVKNMNSVIRYFDSDEAANAYVLGAPYGTCWRYTVPHNA